MFTAFRVPRRAAVAALTVACLFGSAACGDGQPADILVDFSAESEAEAATASQVSESDNADSANPTPTPIMAKSVPTTVPPTPEPIPTLVPRAAPTPTPTPTPSPLDGFGATDILDTELVDLTRDPPCAAIDSLNEPYNVWTQLRTNTVNDIRITVQGSTDDNLEIRLTEAQAATSALAPQVGPMLASFDAALAATSGEANQLILNLRNAEQTAWSRIPAQIEASFNSTNSVNDIVFDVLSATDSPDIDAATVALVEFEMGACRAPSGTTGAGSGASALSAQEQAEIDALCAEVAADPEATSAAAVLEGICEPTS